ncbi:MAG: ATP synthase subunit I [Acidobacteriaceae bacterium]|nr:ATP synthase subunit I [Acidobacteriaceae bacterium]MBV9765020.1 ATP synthase subunit I [Acidobacteriaceae bacterium]
MTEDDLNVSIRRLYWLTALFGALGFVWYFWLQGPRSAFGFALGALGSFGNLWLFEWLSRALGPEQSGRKPWRAGAFIARYVILFLIAYVIVNALGVNLLPVLLGLLASTAAVLTSSIIEIIQGLFGKPSID